FVLRQVADAHSMTAAQVVDRLEVVRADAVRGRADMRIDGDAPVEDRLAPQVAHLADQLDADLDAVVPALGPVVARAVDGIDQADRAGFGEIDRNHAADGPQRAGRTVIDVDGCRDRRSGAVALDDPSQQSRGGLLRIPTFLVGRLRLNRRAFDIHAEPLFPPVGGAVRSRPAEPHMEHARAALRAGVTAWLRDG